MRTHEATRRRLEAFLRALPAGGKAPFARLVGYADRKRILAVSRFGAYLGENTARRLEEIMDEVERGDLVLRYGGRTGPGGYPVLYWERR
jgi:hypothetical protein